MSHRKVIESLYKALCTIYEHTKVRNDSTGRYENKKVKVATDIPCRLSYSSSPKVEQSDGGVVYQSIKLFINPDIIIKPNSTIEITQNNRNRVFECASEPKVYEYHQEVELKLSDRWA